MQPFSAATLGLDIGGTKLAAVLLAADGSLRARRVAPTLRDQGPDDVLARGLELLDGLRAQCPDVAALGVGFAGLVDRAGGRVRSSVILPGWDERPLAAELSARLGLPCAVENDATAAARGEALALGAAGRDLLLVTVGTGIGGALVLGGQLHEGVHGLAGEIGHMTIDWRGEPCWCGAPGCLHTQASGSGLSALALRLSRAQPGSRWHAAAAAPPLQEVAAAAEAGDALARRVISHGAEALGAGLANLVNLLDPGRISLCGGVLGLGAAYLDGVRAALRARALPEVVDQLVIAPAIHGADAGAVGAACLGRLAAAGSDLSRGILAP